MPAPLIALPRKTTTETDFAAPLRHAIARTYGERPDAYAHEIAAVARCRADAVAPGGEDTTARDLLFKYFGQLELLELRFAQEKIAFEWADAFTGKTTVQTSLAFEKASVLHRIAAHLSSYAAGQPRTDPEGIKRAYTALRQSAGLLGFINENFLHAPSTDLSRPVLAFCSALMTAQAAQVFLERCVAERKPPSLAARIAGALAHAYAALGEDSAQFQGKGILDRAWLDVITIKARYYASLAQWYRATHEHERGEYGNSISRFGQALAAAGEAHRLAKEFSYTFVQPTNDTLPADAATSLLELTKTHLATTQESSTTAERDNDLIYHALPTSETLLPPIDPLPLTTLAPPITIQEIYAQPAVTALIGPDIFHRLVPLEVHEQASVYSEEKAKLVRGEVERTERAAEEVALLMSEVDPRARCARLRTLLTPETRGVPPSVSRWAADLSRAEQRPVEHLFTRLRDAQRGCRDSLEALGRELDDESRECERMRVKYTHRWTQQPSATFTRALRGDLKSHAEALAAAQGNDESLAALWRGIASDIAVLGSPRALERAFEPVASGPVDLLDVEVKDVGLSPGDERAVEAALEEVEAGLKRLEAVTGEQDEVLKDFKQKVQADDVSHLLLLNRGRQDGAGAEPTLFATELEKFKPYQARLAAAIQTRKDVLEDIASTLRRVEAVPGVKRLMRERVGEDKRAQEVEARFRKAWEGYEDVRAGLEKGLEFYDSMKTLLDSLRRDIRAFVSSRTQERNRLVAEAETRDRLTGAASPPAVRSPPPPQNLEDQLAGLRMGSVSPYSTYPTQAQSLPPPSPYGNASAQSYLPPPPPSRPMAPPQVNPYDFSSFGSTGVPSRTYAQPPQPPSNGYPASQYPGMMPPQPQPPQHTSSPYPPPPPARPSAYPPPPPPQSAQGYYPPPGGAYPGYQPPSGQGYR